MNSFKEGSSNNAWVYVLIVIVTFAGVAFLKWWEIHTATRALQGMTDSVAISSQSMITNLHQDLDRANALQMERTQIVNEQIKHKARLVSISGCSTNVKRDNCKCFDKSGGIESILDQQQCLAVVDRGLVALQDF